MPNNSKGQEGRDEVNRNLVGLVVTAAALLALGEPRAETVTVTGWKPAEEPFDSRHSKTSKDSTQDMWAAAGSGVVSLLESNGEDLKESADSKENTKPECRRNPTAGNPVILATGEKLLEQRDVATAGLYGLSLSRTYRSKSTVAGQFGPKWTFDAAVPSVGGLGGCYNHPVWGCIPQQAQVRFPGGGVYTYTRTGTLTYTIPGFSSMGTVTYSPEEGWSFTHQKRNYFFSLNGQAQTMSTLGGTLLLQFTYSVSAR